MARVLLPTPSTDFDPTESAVPWQFLSEAGHEVVVATPDGHPGACDPRMIAGTGLGLMRPFLVADKRGQAAWRAFAASEAFTAPLAWDTLDAADFDALVLPGGHAPGMKPYLESEGLQRLVVDFFRAGKLVGAICHGVVLACRSVDADTGRSVLHGRKTTALLGSQEMLAWRLTRRRLGDYYRTYPTTVQDEVTLALARPEDFLEGPSAFLRDTPGKLKRGFVVRDGNYVSSRWPGDAHAFSATLLELLHDAAQQSSA